MDGELLTFEMWILPPAEGGDVVHGLIITNPNNTHRWR